MTKEKFIEMVSAHYDSITSLNKISNFYDYEKGFTNIMRQMGQEIMSANLGEIPKDKRKKKTLTTTFGKIVISNVHPFSENINGFRYSPLMQELITYVGQLNVYEQGNEILNRLLGIEVSNMQVNNITDFYGAACGEESELLAASLTAVKEKEVLYAAVDGSMLFTRDDGWKEVKVARLFKSSDCIDSNGNESWIKHSQYYGHLGESKKFTDNLEKLLDNYEIQSSQLVIISDGATWIRHWSEDAYSNSIAILDYYHAVEHLHKFKAVAFDDENAGKEWAEKQSALLLESETETVIENIRKATTQKSEKEAANLISYYEVNKSRMDYKKYKTIGAGIIGSGAVESAHKTLVQARMKKPGQKWSKEGAQHMLNLKAMYLNEKWNNVINLTKNNLKAA